MNFERKNVFKIWGDCGDGSNRVDRVDGVDSGDVSIVRVKFLL